MMNDVVLQDLTEPMKMVRSDRRLSITKFIMWKYLSKKIQIR
jgi:hypothetical protein